MDDVDDDGGTAGRRRPALGDSVTGDRADSPPLRDGIVDQLAVVASSGVRKSESASLASVGTSYTPQTSLPPSSSSTSCTLQCRHQREWDFQFPFLQFPCRNSHFHSRSQCYSLVFHSHQILEQNSRSLLHNSSCE